MDTQLRNEHDQLLQNDNKKLLCYGTSGFRDNANYLKFVGWRVGLFVGMMSRNTQSKLGVMITASHNKITDNGFKIVPPKGGMLSQEEEKSIEIFYQAEHVKQVDMAFENGTVFVGRDTRPSSEELSKIVLEGIREAGAIGVNLGVVTTPQCAFLIYAHNLRLIDNISSHQQFYVEYFGDIFLQLVKTKIKGALIVDGAEGVGGLWIHAFRDKLKDILTIKPINHGEEGHLLNEQCGSEFVQKQKQLPKQFQFDPTSRYASVDGDADRLVYFHYDQKSLQIVEGDRFAILFALYVKKEIETNPNVKLSIGIIQTAYANSASTKFIKEQIRIEAKYEPTGVKYLHRAAHYYDIGIYFEANGHGAIVYKDHVLDLLKSNGLHELELFLRLSNQAVGDAITNILMTEFLLQKLSLTVSEWLQQYQDYPSISTKLYVKNKEIIKTNYEETQLVKPEDLKEKVDKVMQQYDQAYRTCIRPSGTEDVVRVHSEGPELVIVQEIDIKINQLLREYMEI